MDAEARRSIGAGSRGGALWVLEAVERTLAGVGPSDPGGYPTSSSPKGQGQHLGRSH